MSRFVDEAVARAGLGPVLAARRAQAGERSLERFMETLLAADLLALGAVADEARAADAGDVVVIHARAAEDVRWIEAGPARGDLDLLRAVAIARIVHGGRVGVDWSRAGLEIAQVALGFGASDLAGPITKKSGRLVLADEAQRVKGEGMVDVASLVRREIASLVKHAGRVAVFVDESREPRDSRESRDTEDSAHA